MTNLRREFLAAARSAGIADEVASILHDAFRDSHEHRWSEQAREWCGDSQQLIERAKEAPDKMAAVCSYFFAIDGGCYYEGLKNLPTEIQELAESVLEAGWTEKPEASPLTESEALDSSPIAGWKIGEPPKDGRLYVAFGRIIWADKYGGGSTPFLSQVRYASRDDWKGWLNENDLAISSNIEDQVHIDHHISLPNT